MRTIITYGTFDILHIGHINLLRRARALGDRLVVGLSTDAFNRVKHKTSLLDYANGKVVLEAMRDVDLVIPEENWEQQITDVQKYNVATFVIGANWTGEFNFLQEFCEVRYLSRTED